MKMQTAARLLEILSVPLEEAMTTEQIGCKWHGKPGPTRQVPSTLTASELRNIQRYVTELSSPTKDGPALLDVIESKLNKRSIRKYYHKKSRIAHWLMTEEAALNILLTRQILGRAFGSVEQIGSKAVGDVAEKVAGISDQTRRIREHLRVVPDGIGRLPARISHKVLQATVDAIAQDRQLRFNYRSSKGAVSEQVVSPRGLVAKDGTIYLLATKGLSDMPKFPFPLQRMSEAVIHHKPSQARPDFDLDRYIHNSHQLSHVLDGKTQTVELKLRVSPDSLYHFAERPLSGEQTIGPARRSDGWRVVTANIPDTVLLVPFLLSMGGWIEVLGPPEVRKKMSESLREMSAHYRDDATG